MARSASEPDMRTLTLGLVALLAIAPFAAAQGPQAAITLSSPTPYMAMGADDTQPITLDVELVLDGVICYEPASFVVALETSSSGPLSIELETTEVVFEVAEGSYVAQPYEDAASLNATLVTASQTGPAEAAVVATLDGDEDACLVPGGFEESSTTYTITMNVGEAEPEGGETPAGGAATNETAEGNASADANETAEGDTTGEGNMTVDDTPDESTSPGVTPGSGFIGDYEGGDGAGEDGGSPIPAPGVALALVAGAVAAAAGAAMARRRKP